MKTQSQIQSSQFAGGGNLVTPINPVFVECLCQLREISRRIFEICEGDLSQNCRAGYLPDFEEHISETAESIGEMARVDFLDNLFFSDSKGKEACDA